jgi:hypothetical protein
VGRVRLGLMTKCRFNNHPRWIVWRLRLSLARVQAMWVALFVVLLAAPVNKIPPAVRAESEATINILPATRCVPSGETRVLDIQIDNATGLWSADVRISFDPSVLQVVDSDPWSPGVQVEMGDFLVPDFVLLNTVDNIHGVIAYAASQSNPRPPANGHGILASITFQAVGSGSSAIRFTYQKLTDIDGFQIAASSYDGQLTVVNVCGSLRADMNCDDVVTSTDIMQVADGWDSRLGESSFDRWLDLTGDNQIDIRDVMVTVAAWGSHC